MQYPTVTEKPSEREAVAHDTFIDGLTVAPAAAPAPAPRSARLPRRRRTRTARHAPVIRV